MKSIIIFLLSGSIAFASNAQPVKSHGQLKVQGTQLVDKNNEPVVLNGMSFGWSCFHPRFYTPGVVQWLAKDWKCSVLRAALCVEPNGGYLKDSAASKKLIRSV